MKKKLALLIVLVFVNAITLFPQAKEDDIRKLLEISGSGDLGIQVMNEIINQFKTLLPEVPERFWDAFMKEVDASTLIELVIPIYDKYYTHEDIKGILEFYNTPLGQKLIKVQPAITADSMAVGQQWGRMMGEKIRQRLIDEGYIDV